MYMGYNGERIKINIDLPENYENPKFKKPNGQYIIPKICPPQYKKEMELRNEEIQRRIDNYLAELSAKAEEEKRQKQQEETAQKQAKEQAQNEAAQAEMRENDDLVTLLTCSGAPKTPDSSQFRWRCGYLTPFPVSQFQDAKYLMALEQAFTELHDITAVSFELGIHPPTNTWIFVLIYDAFPPYSPEPETPEE